MKNLVFLFFLITSLTLPQLHAKPVNVKNFIGENVDLDADTVDFNNVTGLFQARGNVVLKSGNIKLTCDSAEVNQKTGDFKAFGKKLIISENKNTWEGTEVKGNYITRTFETKDFAVSHNLVFIKGEKAISYPALPYAQTQAEKELAGKVVITNAIITTCDYLHSDHAHYTMESSKVVINSDGYIDAKNVFFKIKDVPVFYLPYLKTQDSSGIGLAVKGGYKSDFGAYLKLRNRIELNEHIDTNFLLDFFTKRGIGFGNETNINTNNSRTRLYGYGINDQDSPETDELVDGLPPTEDYNKRFLATDDRYRLTLTHHSDWTEELGFDVHLDKLSDIDMLEDFYETEYDDTFQPVSKVSLSYLTEDLHIAVSSRPKLNDFYNVVQKNAELQIDYLRNEIKNSNVYYEGFTNLADLEMKWREADRARSQNKPDLEDYDSLRFDTLHSIFVPMTYDNWLNIVPRAGVRATYYSDSSKSGVTYQQLNENFDVAEADNVTGQEDVTNYDDMGGELWRFTGEVGMELSLKKYKTWNEYSSEFLRLDGLRHIVEPYMNWTSVIDPSEDKDNIYFFDDVDRVDELNFLRVGTRQRFQTRRNKKIYTFASVDTYADFHATTRDEIEHLGDLGTMATFKPKEKLTIWTRLLIGMDNAELNEFEIGTKFGDPNSFETTISYLYRDNYVAAPVNSMNSYLANYGSNSYFERGYEEANSLNMEFAFPINEKFRAKIGMEYDFYEWHLVEHYYELQRDLHCWTSGLRVGWDDGSFEAMIIFYLKAVPSYNLARHLYQD